MNRLERTRQSPAILVAAIALVAALAGTALAGSEPTADSSGAAKNAKKALKLAKKNKKKIKNIELTPGPEGPAGPSTGPAGGDLSGSYPNPSIANGAVGTAAVGAIPAVKGALKAAAQSIPNSTTTPMAWNSEFFDTVDMHSEIALNSRLTAPTDGVYHVSGSIRWKSNSTGSRTVKVRENGGVFRATNIVTPEPSGETFQTFSTLLDLEANDYIEVVVEQDSGSALDVSLASGTEVSMFWVGPRP